MNEFINNAIRVLKLSRKPTKDEVLKLAKVTGIGMILVGLIGYVIQLVYFMLTMGGLP